MDEVMRTCPYDPNHVVRSGRLNIMFSNAKRNFERAAIETCPFNAKHQVSRAEYRFHCSVCPDRFRVAYEEEINREESQAMIENMKSSTYSLPYSESKVSFDSEENWDDEIPKVAVMQPRSHLASSSYVNLTQKQRKQLRSDMIETYKKTTEQFNPQ